jgi:HlyD family secretion protein
MKGKLKGILALSLLLAGGGALVAVRARAAQPAHPALATAPVRPGHVAAKVTASGTLSALNTVQIGSQVSGRVIEVDADFNAPVKKGQVLARIDPEPFRAAEQQAAANMQVARANLEKARVEAADAERQAGRQDALFAQKLIAAADRDTARAAADAARSQVTAAAAGLSQAQAAEHQAAINLSYTVISSPIDGLVISRSVDVGQTVAASLQAPTLFTIAEDLKRMQVDSSVAESDVGRLAAGMKASFTVDAYPGETFVGVVRQVRNAAQTVQNVVTYDAVIDVDNPRLELKPGMTANVGFIVAEADGLVVPNAALRYHPAGAAAPPHTIWVLHAASAAPEPVAIDPGVSDGTVTAVAGPGLAAGDRVVVAAPETGAGPATPAGARTSARGGAPTSRLF